MTSHLDNNHMNSDELLNEEQMMFPYLVTLDSDVKLLEDHDENPEIVIAPTVPAIKITVEPTQTNPTSGLDTTVTGTLVPENNNTEGTQNTDETLNSLRKQLAEAQRDITELRHHIGQSQMRFLDFGVRMISVENTIGRLGLLQPATQNTNLLVCNSKAQTTLPVTPMVIDTVTDVTKTTKNQREDPNANISQPQAKRAKIIQTKEIYKGTKPFCPKCTRHHEGQCVKPCKRCNTYGHQVLNCKIPPKSINSKAMKGCFKCRNTGHVQKNCPLQVINGNNGYPHVGTAGTSLYNNLDLRTILLELNYSKILLTATDFASTVSDTGCSRLLSTNSSYTMIKYKLN